MIRLFRVIKSLFCEHIYGDGVMNPFIDEYGNHSAIYTCEKCGHKEIKYFVKH